MINAIELMVTDHKAHLIPPLHHNHVVAAVVGGSVLDLHGGSLLDPLLTGLVRYKLLGTKTLIIRVVQTKDNS